MKNTIEDDQVIPVSPTPTYVAAFPTISSTSTDKTPCNRPPFDHSRQICEDLEFIHDAFSQPCLRSLTKEQRLPDAPSVPIDIPSVISYGLQDLDTPSLNKLNLKLWWCGANPIVKSLTHQLTFERRIVVTESPSLHLVLSENRIVYLKPLPAYLCSHAFWEAILDPTTRNVVPEDRTRLIATSLGFLQTYTKLITHRSDFTLAMEHHLLPLSPGLTFESFVAFTSAFKDIPACSVSPRWRYGELLLDTLNFHSGLFLRRYHFNRFEHNHGVYFQRFFPVTLFLFASFSVILSAMQVILTGRQMMGEEGVGKGFKRTMGIFEWFGVEVIGWAVAFSGMFLVWWIGMAGLEGWKMRGLRRRVARGWKEEEKARA